MKNQKGITLVALVITIVVLLILAGVTISMVMGDNGVLNNSQKAKDNSAKGSAEDALSTALGSVSTEYYANNVGGSISDDLATKLETSAPGYTYFYDATDSTNIKVQMNQKNSNYKFQAIVSDQLTVKSFKMVAGARTNEDALFTELTGNV